MGCNLNIIKRSSTTYAVISDILTYEIIISNTSCTIAENVVVKDLLPEELKFILGSVTVNNIEDNYSNVIAGVNLGSIHPNETKVVTFKAQIIKKICDFVENKSIVEFKYQDKEQLQCDCCYSDTNKVFIKNPKLSIEKYADKNIVQLHDEITYTIKIANTGDLDLYNIFLVDDIPNSIKLIDSTFSIDNKVINSVEIEKGVMLDNIKIGECKVIKYKVKVISGGCNSRIKNKAIAKYSYTLCNGYTAYKESNEAVSFVDVKISSFKQISVDNFITIPVQKPDMSEVNEINAHVKINNCNIIKTSKALSTEGQYLSGYKLVVHGNISQIIEYAACEPTQSVHSTHSNIPFSSYIILPADFKPGNKVEVNGIVENIYFSKISDRNIFSNTTLLLMAKISCCI